MESLQHILKVIVLIFIVVLSFNVIIFVHELGHFWAARWRGLVVERFQIWFGKPIWKKTINGVQYGLGWIPAGGFVALPQMAPMEAIEGSNENAGEKLPPVSPLDKIIVAFAGPLFSLTLGVIAAVGVWQLGVPKNVVETTQVGYVVDGSPAEKSGIKAGDTILSINGERVTGFLGTLDCIQEKIIFSSGDSVEIELDRPGQGIVKLTTAFEVKKADHFWKRDGVRSIGIKPASELHIRSLIKGSPAAYAGFKPGDQVMAINGIELYSHSQFVKSLSQYKDKVFKLKIKREDQVLELKAASMVPTNGYKVNLKKEPQPMFGVLFSSYSKKSMKDANPLVYPTVTSQIKDTSLRMWVMLRSLFDKKSGLGVQHMSGPVGIAKVKYFLLQSEHPWRQMLTFWVLFNVNLAILNLLPLPVLDGGHITTSLIEIITRRPVNAKVLEYLQLLFVSLFLALFLYIGMKDSFTSFSSDEPQRKIKKPIWSQSNLQELFQSN